MDTGAALLWGPEKGPLSRELPLYHYATDRAQLMWAVPPSRGQTPKSASQIGYPLSVTEP